MQEVMTIEKIFMMEKKIINEIGIPSILLMENAATEIFSEIVNKGENFIVYCGKGNNAGDGLALARKLILASKKVKIVIINNYINATEQFTANYNILKNIGADIQVFNREIDNEFIADLVDTDVVVDAIFGIGLNKEITGVYYNVIEAINKFAKFTVSIDIPSGLDGTSGRIKNICIEADQTLTVEVFKKGFLNYNAFKYLGNVKVISIGMPMQTIKEFSEGIKLSNDKLAKELIPKRKLSEHKGDFGRVLILAGSKGFTGAAYIVAEAAIRTGSGLVNLVVEDELQAVLDSKLIEGMTVGYSDDARINKLIEQADVIACGPGLSTRAKNKDMLIKFIKNSKCPIVLDADALNIISSDKSLIENIKNRAILTPHPGEMARLIGKDIDYIEENRIEVCKRYSEENEVITLLKGYSTLISNGQEIIVNTTGSSKMASGGMGDCLSGMITSLIGQGIGIYNAGILGAYIHGHIGDKLGALRYSVNARDVIEEIPFIINQLME
jgi:NAD(P)H-hydrate epimerase